MVTWYFSKHCLRLSKGNIEALESVGLLRYFVMLPYNDFRNCLNCCNRYWWAQRRRTNVIQHNRFIAFAKRVGHSVCLSAGFHKNHWTDFYETWKEDESQPRIDPIKETEFFFTLWDWEFFIIFSGKYCMDPKEKNKCIEVAGIYIYKWAKFNVAAFMSGLRFSDKGPSTFILD